MRVIHTDHIKVGKSVYEIKIGKVKSGVGACNPDLQVIVIDQSIFELPPMKQVEVYLHEIGHTVFTHFNFDLLEVQEKETDIGELAAFCFGEGLAMIMIDNPDFFSEITKIAKKENSKWQRRTKKK